MEDGRPGGTFDKSADNRPLFVIKLAGSMRLAKHGSWVFQKMEELGRAGLANGISGRRCFDKYSKIGLPGRRQDKA